jgi:hypothetical protein
MGTEQNYSKSYTRGSRKYRYNYRSQELELISFYDLDNNYDLVKLETPKVSETYGLALNNWSEGADYWVDVMDREIQIEQQSELAEFNQY